MVKIFEKTKSSARIVVKRWVVIDDTKVLHDHYRLEHPILGYEYFPLKDGYEFQRVRSVNRWGLEQYLSIPKVESQEAQQPRALEIPRYMMMCGEAYYPCGFFDLYHSMDAAIAEARKLDLETDDRWVEVFDLVLKRVVWSLRGGEETNDD